MRCTDCKYSKETIPAQLRYIYCSKYETEMSTATEFDSCQYRNSDEYKLKEAIQNYCNNESNWLIGVSQLDLLNSLANKFNIPDFITDIIARRNFENKVFNILNNSKVKLGNGVLITGSGDGDESRENLLILQNPNENTKGE